jgi:1-deoxy-D-xylulose-5-phosphate reductoisomerase
VGTRALEVAQRLGIGVCAIAAKKNYQLLEEQARRFRPKIVSIYDSQAALRLKNNLKDSFIKVVSGEEGLLEASSRRDSDMVLNAISGISGLAPTLEAINAGKNISMANKESIVAAGEIIRENAKNKGVKILPVDSEHSAIFQCLEGAKKEKKDVKKIFLTASGGPFWGKSREYLEKATIKQTLCHPNWKMGKKITVDSASFMNKGLELIETTHLFDIAPEFIEILVHRQSIIHSMVQYRDNSVMAQMSSTDMGLPIQYAITWPEKFDSCVAELDFAELRNLSFEKFDEEIFKLPSICRNALKLGGTAPAFLVGAGEKAVELFLDSKISFLPMIDLIIETFSAYKPCKILSINDVMAANSDGQNSSLEIFFKSFARQ